MGAMGSGFGQGFAQTLLTLGPMVQKNQQEREQLELQSKLAKASLQKHEAETAILTQKLQRGEGLRELMTQGVPTPGASSPGSELDMPFQAPPTRQPFAMGNPQHRALYETLDPEFAQKRFLAEAAEQTKQEGADRRLASARPMFDAFMGGGAPGAPQVGPSAPTPAGAGTPPPGAGGGGGLGPIQDRDVSMKFNPETGAMEITAKKGNAKWEIKDSVGDDPKNPGFAVLIRDFINPMTGETHRTFMGPPRPDAAIERFVLAADSLGLKRGSAPHSAAVADLAAASALPGEMQAHALASIESRYKGVGGPTPKPGTGAPAAPSGAPTGGAPAPQTGAAGAIAAKNTADVVTAARTEAAKIQVQLQNKPLEGPAATKYVALEGIQRKGVAALELFRPEYVGKPFIDKFKGEFAKAEKLGKDYTPGALAGAMREFFGNATPEEVTFRRSVLEIADDVLRARSGAAINESEYKRITAFLAMLTDEPTTFKAAMGRLIGETTAQMKSTVKLATTPATKLDANPTTPNTNDAARQPTRLGGPRFRYDPKGNRLVPVAP